MKTKKIYAVIASLIIGLTAAGCSSSDSSADSAAAASVTQSSSVSKSVESSDTSGVVTAAANISASDSEQFTKRDLKQEADLEGAIYLTAADGKTLDVTEEGVYVISGSAKNCTVRVETDKEAKVQLVLDGATIENDDFPAIYVVSCDKCFITSTENGSSLSVTGTFRADGDTNTDAVIFAKDDIVLNGKGTLTVTSAEGNGISCKDDIKITGGSYVINTEKDSIEANDSILIADGSFEITSSKDGLHAENDEDDSTGIVSIAGGTFKITAKSDAIQGTALAEIGGGSFELKGAEGIEATVVRINDGEISITASDDGVNASQKSSSVGTPLFEMNGGSLTIVMGSGDTDAIDVNGNVTVNGGTIDITVPQTGMCESFDYDGTAKFNGGTIIVNGSEVSEIPTPKMMGGGKGGRNGGGFRPFDGGAGRGDMNSDGTDTEGSDTARPGRMQNGEMPEGYDEDFPGKFKDGELPEDFKERFGGEMPEEFKERFDGEMPEGFEGRRNKNRNKTEDISETSDDSIQTV